MVGDDLPLTTSQCASSSTIAFVQIAAKNGVVFGLDKWGIVFFYGGVNSACWTHVGNGAKNDFAVSIVTDNDAFASQAVWASDTSGMVWVAE